MYVYVSIRTMPPLTTTTQPARPWRFKILALVGVLVLLALGAFWYGAGGKDSLLGMPQTGGLLLTLQDKDTKNFTMREYSFATGALEPLFANNQNNLTGAFSADGTQVAYMSRQTNDQAYQLYVMNTATKALTQVTNDANRIKREPVWSRSGAYIAYVVQPAGLQGADLSNPDRWQTFLVDRVGKTLGVVGGLHPFFSPDDKTLFVLRANGIYAFPVEQFTANDAGVPDALDGTLVVPTITNPDLPASRSAKVVVSPDHAKLAWLVPKEHFVRVFTVENWSPLTLVKDADIHTIAYGGAFSPDNQFLALQQAQLVGGELANAKIAVYKLSDLRMNEVLDLSSYNPGFIWLGGWR